MKKEHNVLELFNYNAGKGDCIRIRFLGASQSPRNIIIDSGVTRFGLRFYQICSAIAAQGEQVDMLIITHVDDDHLGGLLQNLRSGRKLPIHEVRMNHGRAMGASVDLSARQCDELYTRLLKANVAVKPAARGDVLEIDGAELKVLWPAAELAGYPSGSLSGPYAGSGQDTLLGRHSDYGHPFCKLMEMPLPGTDSSRNNRASIVFEFDFRRVRFLLTGDARAEDFLSGISNSSYDLVKLPHHGSVRNLTEKWGEKIQCRNYFLCTDGIAHPDKQTLARLLKWYGDVHLYVSSGWWRQGLLGEADQEYSGRLHFIEGEKITWRQMI